MNIGLIIEVLGFAVGLLYLWWEYHADNRMWFASMVMPCFSMWIYFNKGLYADFSINIYYLVIAVYGYIVWTRKNHGKSAGAPKAGEEEKKDGGIPIRYAPAGVRWGCAGAALLLWALLYLGLNYLTDSTVPVADAFTTALSIVGMWMLARKYIEEWFVWIAVDAVCVGLYIYKGIYFYAVLYAIYTVIAFYGYRKWLRLMAEQTGNG